MQSDPVLFSLTYQYASKTCFKCRGTKLRVGDNNFDLLIQTDFFSLGLVSLIENDRVKTLSRDKIFQQDLQSSSLTYYSWHVSVSKSSNYLSILSAA